MDDITKYILSNYWGLLTSEEKIAYKLILGEQKSLEIFSPELQNRFKASWTSKNPKVASLLADGNEEFFQSIRDRILRDHSDKIILNLCPKCNSLARTPRATQCSKCFHSWRVES
jgi:hypothetical protein